MTRCPGCGALNPVEAPLPNERVVCSCCRRSFDPKVIGCYELTEVVRCGPVDTVFKAHDREINSTVAIKLPVFGRIPPEPEVERFFEQAQELAYIDHPLVRPLAVVGYSYFQPFAACAYPAGGTTLCDLLASRPGIEQTLVVVLELASALHAVHERWGMVHGDLNPAAIPCGNVGIGQQAPRPSLFACCLTKREVSDNAAGADSSALRITPYMSPEQRQGNVGRS